MKLTNKITIIALAAIAAGSFLALAQTPANNNIVDEIVWVVGDEAVFRSDIEEELQQLRAEVCAARLCPNALGYLVGTHASSEPASQELLRELGIKAPLDAGMHLGEGAGAMAYLPLLDSALRVYRDGKTFTATGMAAYEHFEAGK